MISEELLARIATIPDDPGCYLWKDAEGRVIYVGKAKHLRRRLASYVNRDADNPTRTRRMVREAVEIEWLVTDSEVEALLCENQLIKDLQPRAVPVPHQGAGAGPAARPEGADRCASAVGGQRRGLHHVRWRHGQRGSARGKEVGAHRAQQP